MIEKYSILSNVRIDYVDPKTNVPIFWGDDISFSYTIKDDDITGARLNSNTPYESRRGNLVFKEKIDDTVILHNESLLTELNISLDNDMIIFDLKTELNELSEFGLNLPFNFMGKKNGGKFDEQYLFNSPYRSIDNNYKYCYLNNMKGSDIIVAFLSEADGWKMDYSPWVGGHYFTNLKCLANFDEAYKTNSKHKELKLALLFVDGLEDGMKKLSKLYEAPILCYDKSYTFNNKGIVKVIGDCDRIDYVKDGKLIKTEDVNNDTFLYSDVYGKVTLIPYFKGKKGLDCSIFGYKSLKEMFKLSNESILTYKGDTLGNLCEQEFWTSSMMRYMIENGKRDDFNNLLNGFFKRLFPKDEKDAVRYSVFKESKLGLPEYSVYNSRRIQEHFAGVSILLDAYKLYNDKFYLDFAVGMLNSLIDNYQHDNGGFFTSFMDKSEDYSTVTCLILAIIDMTLFFKDKDNVLYSKYLNSAKKLANYVYNRGMNFPTEGGESKLAEEQMEDGSISCSALTLLYYCAKIERKEEYITKAKEIMDLHDYWVMKTPDANVFYSTLRWWETRWEGDKDGPAICCGHGWTIWRAEADFWYYKLTNDVEYLHKSLNGFTSNLAKFNEKGESYSIYHVDYIAGGGFQFEKKDIKYRILNRFPDNVDLEVTRYAWVRGYETILKLTDEELNK